MKRICIILLIILGASSIPVLVFINNSIQLKSSGNKATPELSDFYLTNASIKHASQKLGGSFHVNEKIRDGSIKEIKKIFESNCYKCHSGTKLKGGLDLQSIINDDKNVKLRDQVLKKSFLLTLANIMPPIDSKPLGENKRKLLELIAQYGLNSRPAHKPRPLTIRYSPQELTSKFEELLNIDLSLDNPLEKIPDNLKLDRDKSDKMMNGFVLNDYIEAVSKIVEGTFSNSELGVAGYERNFQQPIFWKRKTNGIGENIIWYGGQNTENNGTMSIKELHENGLPYSGYYDIKVTARAQNRGRIPDEVTGVDSKEPLRFGLLTGISKKAGKSKPQYWHEANEKYLAEFDLQDGEYRTFEKKVWLDKDYYPRFVYMNGALLQHKLIKRLEKYSKKNAGHETNWHIFITEEVDAQYIEVKSFSIKSLNDNNKYAKFWGNNYDQGNFDQRIISFAEKAYDVNLSSGEKDELLSKVYNFSKEHELQLKEKFKYAIKLILSSPIMLYKKIVSEKTIRDYISRRLIDHSVIKPMSQTSISKFTENLTYNTGSYFFAKSFMDHWLDIKKSNSINPFVRTPYYRNYYIDRVKGAAIKESYLSFLYMLRNNRSLLDGITSDYKLINYSLQKHYNLKGGKKISPSNCLASFKRTQC